jgi:hypothetical protein
MRILAATAKYREEFAERGKENAQRLRALVLLLRYTGIRIRDAVGRTSNAIKSQQRRGHP